MRHQVLSGKVRVQTVVIVSNFSRGGGWIVDPACHGVDEK
jgi:hypothetical protein